MLPQSSSSTFFLAKLNQASTPFCVFIFLCVYCLTSVSVYFLYNFYNDQLFLSVSISLLLLPLANYTSHTLGSAILTTCTLCLCRLTHYFLFLSVSGTVSLQLTKIISLHLLSKAKPHGPDGDLDQTRGHCYLRLSNILIIEFFTKNSID